MALAFRATTMETVAAGSTDQVLGTTGNSGDLLEYLLAVPASTSPGAISIKDSSSGAAITLFAGGASSLSNLVPFTIPVGPLGGLKAVTDGTTDGWLVTTGASIAVVAFGKFT